MSPPGAAGRLLLLWACGLTPLLVWPSSFDMFEQPKQLALKLAAAAVVLLAAAQPGGLGLPGVVAGPVGLGLALGLAATLATPLPVMSWFGEYTSYQGWLHLLALAALLAAASAAARDGGGRRFLVASLLGCLAASGYALLQAAGLDPAAWSLNGPPVRAFSTEGNAMFLGHLLAAGFPLAVGLAAGSGRWRWIAAAALIFAGLLSSGSRAALAACAAGGLVAMRLVERPAARPVGARLLAGCGTVLVLGAVLLPAERSPFPALGARFADLLHGREGRAVIWAGSGRLIARAPLLGSGLDSFATLHLQVQTPALWERLWRGSPEKAHNELLQLAAGAGLPAAGALLWLGAVLARLARRSRDGVTAAAAGSLAASVVCACFGFTTCGPEAVALPALAALLARSPVLVISRPATAALAAALCASLVLHGGFAASEVALKRAVATPGAAGLALDLEAVRAGAPWAQSFLRAGDGVERAALGAALAGDNRPPDATLVDRLTALYGRALALNDRHPFASSDLGRLAARRGDFRAAETFYRRARELAPLDAYLALEHAQALMGAAATAGKKDAPAWLDRAEAALRDAAAPYPTFAEPVGMLGYLALMRGRTAEAEALLARSLDLDWHGNMGAAYAAASNLAALYHRKGREAEAQRAFYRAQQFAALAGR